MSKVMNIGVLDVRGISEEVAGKIGELENIGVLIENDRSQILLKDTKKSNVGSTIKIADGQDLKVIMHNGELKVDQEYLEGILSPIVLLLNGRIVFDKTVDNITLNEKIHSIMVNGELICPKRLAGLLQSKGTINGQLLGYASDYNFYNGSIKLTNKFLKSIKGNSKISLKKLVVLEDIDPVLLEEKISNMEVLKKLIIVEEYEDVVSQYIDDYYGIKKIIVPGNGREVKYIDENINLDNTSILKYDHNVVFVDGRVSIKLTEDVDFSSYIELLICDKVVCNEETYEMIKNNLGEEVKVEIIEGQLIENLGKMVLTGDIEEKMTIVNKGKLVLDENLNYDSFVENVISIKNYGLIEGPEDKLGIIRSVIKENYGKIKAVGEDKKGEGDKEEDILYSNVGELKL